MTPTTQTFTAFGGPRRIARGPLADVALATKAWLAQGGAGVLLFDDQTGQQLDLDLRGTDAEALERLSQHPWIQRLAAAEEKRPGPGRPKLGVVCREVSLLPRHWDWLNEQPGGASSALRKLVEARMKAGRGADRARKAHEAAAKFAWTMGGDLPGFEEASRALARREYDRFHALIAAWPADIRDHLAQLVAAAVQADQAQAAEAGE